MVNSLPRSLRTSWYRRATYPPFLCSAVIAVLVFGAFGCQPQKALEGHGLLPPAPSGQDTSTAPAPATPFTQTDGKAAFARMMLQTAGPANTQITVRDLIVGPRGDAQLTIADSASLIEVYSGAGSVASGTITVALTLHQPVILPEGSRANINNSGDAPLMVRLYTVEGK